MMTPFGPGFVLDLTQERSESSALDAVSRDYSLTAPLRSKQKEDNGEKEDNGKKRTAGLLAVTFCFTLEQLGTFHKSILKSSTKAKRDCTKHHCIATGVMLQSGRSNLISG
jgi:hypothetical protein